MTMWRGETRSRAVFWSVSLLLLAGIAVQAFATLTWGNDDAYISYRFARNAAEGHGLVFNPGERVEGYTNLLYVLCVIPAFWLGLDGQVYFFSLFLNAVFIIAALAVFWREARRSLPGAWATAVCFLFALCPFVWQACADGLETPLVVLVQVSIWALVRRLEEGGGKRAYWGLALCVAVSMLTRADGFIAPGVAVVYLILKGRWRNALWLGGWSALVLGAYIAFRLQYYGYPLPNTYYAKVSGELSQRMAYGWNQLRDAGLHGFAPYLAAFGVTTVLLMWKAAKHLRPLWRILAWTGEQAVLFLYRQRHHIGSLLEMAEAACSTVRRLLRHLRSPGPRTEVSRALFSYEVFAAWCWLAYWHYIGGDFMGIRFLLFLFPLGAFHLAVRLSSHIRKTAWIALVLAPVVLWQWVPLATDNHFRYGFQKYDAWKETGEFLAREYPGKTVAVDAAGKMPYFSGLYAMDMLGLNDVHIAHKEIRNYRYSGHNKWDADYILERHPDLIAGFVQYDLNLQYDLTEERYAGHGYRMAWLVDLRRADPGRVDVRGMPREALKEYINQEFLKKGHFLMGVLERQEQTHAN